jgi:hypothetical protein
MAQQKEYKKDFSTCIDDSPFAGMMQKLSGQQGIGSLCAEMMKSIMEKQGDGSSFNYAEIMRSMMKNCCGIDEELKKVKKEEGHVRDEQ